MLAGKPLKVPLTVIKGCFFCASYSFVGLLTRKLYVIILFFLSCLTMPRREGGDRVVFPLCTISPFMVCIYYGLLHLLYGYPLCFLFSSDASNIIIIFNGCLFFFLFFLFVFLFYCFELHQEIRVRLHVSNTGLRSVSVVFLLVLCCSYSLFVLWQFHLWC